MKGGYLNADVEVSDVVATVILVLSYVGYWVAYAMPKKKYYLLVNLCAIVLTLTWYVLIQRYDGVADQIISILRDVLILVVPKKYKHFVFVGVTVLNTVFLCYTWSGWSTLVLLVVASIGLGKRVYAGMGLLRVLSVIQSVLYAAYLFMCGQYAGTALEMCGTVACRAAQAYKKRKKVEVVYETSYKDFS